jgi:hypothetical protein
VILPHRLKRLRTSSRCRSSISEAYGYQQIIALYMMLISGDVARLAESVAGCRLYPELIGIEHPRRHGGFYLYSNFDSHREHLADARSIPGLNRSSQQCVGDWTVRDAENAAVVA